MPERTCSTFEGGVRCRIRTKIQTNQLIAFFASPALPGSVPAYSYRKASGMARTILVTRSVSSFRAARLLGQFGLLTTVQCGLLRPALLGGEGLAM